jgi:hypothetical protein
VSKNKSTLHERIKTHVNDHSEEILHLSNAPHTIVALRTQYANRLFITTGIATCSTDDVWNETMGYLRAKEKASTALRFAIYKWMAMQRAKVSAKKASQAVIVATLNGLLIEQAELKREQTMRTAGGSLDECRTMTDRILEKLSNAFHSVASSMLEQNA